MAVAIGERVFYRADTIDRAISSQVLPVLDQNDRIDELQQSICYAMETTSVHQGHEFGPRRTRHPVPLTENGGEYKLWLEEVARRDSDYLDTVLYKTPLDNGTGRRHYEVCRRKGRSGKIVNAQGKPITPEETAYAIKMVATIVNHPRLPFT